jgi:hypothetical protein
MTKKNINRWDEDTINDITTAFAEAIKSIEEKYSVNITHGNLRSGKTAHEGFSTSGTRLDLSMANMYISLDPDCMGLEFNEKEKKDWKTYQNRSTNKLMKQIRLGVPLEYEGAELRSLLTCTSANVFQHVSHAKIPHHYGFAADKNKEMTLDRKYGDASPDMDVVVSVIPCGRHKKMFKTFIPIKVISRLYNRDRSKVISEKILTASVDGKVFNDIVTQNKLKKLMIQTIKEAQA